MRDAATFRKLAGHLRKLADLAAGPESAALRQMADECDEEARQLEQASGPKVLVRE